MSKTTWEDVEYDHLLSQGVDPDEDDEWDDELWEHEPYDSRTDELISEHRRMYARRR